MDARDAQHPRPGSRATPQAQTALVSAPWGACRCHSNVPQASGFTCVARRWTSGSRVGNALCTETLRDGSLMERIRPRPRGSELRCGHGLAALAREAPAAPAARAGSPFPERGAALFPTEREGLRSGAGVTRGWNACHPSPSRGGSRDVTEFCSLDRDTAQAAPAGELSLFFFSCLPLSALTNAGQPGRTLPISKLNLQESAAGTFCIPPDCRPLCGVQLVV